MTDYDAMADDLAKQLPEHFSRFLSACKHQGIVGALAQYHLSQDLGILHLWAIKIKREHPEIRK